MRFTCLTNGFSKTLDNPIAAISLILLDFMYYTIWLRATWIGAALKPD
jgi:hypothetical protein